jgi:hypothetical protein
MTYNDEEILREYFWGNRKKEHFFDDFVIIWNKLLDYESFGIPAIRESEKYQTALNLLYTMLKNRLIIYDFPTLLIKYSEYEANEKLRIEQLKIRQFHDSGLGAIFEKYGIQYSESLFEELKDWATVNYSDD